MLNDKEIVVGRILDSTMENARAEFNSSVKEGDLVAFIVNDEEINARVDYMETTPAKGLEGYISFRERPSRPPKLLTPLYTRSEVETGVLYLGTDYRGNTVKIEVNPLFNHAITVGMTQQGKTHLLIVIAEECAKYGIPTIIFDTQGEFTNLPEKFKNTVVVEDITLPNLIAHLQQRRVVVVNLLGLGNAYKAIKLVGILGPFYEAKEKDYADNENNWQLLTIPPTLIMVDEADVFAPKRGMRGRDYVQSAEILEEIAKRGSKLGLGLFVATQRITKLAIDVRDNCNSVFCFRIVGRSNRFSLREMHLFSTGVINKINSFTRGECIILGQLGNRTIRTRDIVTKRTKNVDFKTILGINPPEEEEEIAPSIVLTDNGSIIDQDFNRVIANRKERERRKDKEAYEANDGDGVVRRTEALPEELIEELSNELPFSTHLTDEDQKLMKKLKELNDENTN